MEGCLRHCFSDAVRRYESKDFVQFSINRKDIYEWLTQQGLGDGSGSMAIPRVVRTAPVEMKSSFIARCARATVRSLRGKTSCIKLTTKSKVLAAQTQLELMNLGIVTVRWPALVKDYGYYHNVQITARGNITRFDERVGFVFPRKTRDSAQDQSGWDRSCLSRDLPRRELEWLFEARLWVRARGIA